MNVQQVPIAYEGSVKNVRVVEQPATDKFGYGFFEYSDRYSVFDWGEMPDTLKGKGAALAILTSYFFNELQIPCRWDDFKSSKVWDKIEDKDFADSLKNSDALKRLAKCGLSTHYEGIDTGNGFILDPANLENPVNVVGVSLVRVEKPTIVSGGYDYSWFSPEQTNFLSPLEVIFRFGIPEGSSILKRADDSAYLETLGLKERPKEGDWLPRPIIEYTTKLEPDDRIIKDLSVAQKMSGLTPEQFEQGQKLTYLVALYISDVFSKAGIELWDGKLEWAVGPKRELVLVDAIGPDELRLIKNGVQVSKEPLRQWYKKNNYGWHAKFEQIKGEVRRINEEQGLELDPRTVCENEGYAPVPLDRRFKRTIENMYMALTAETTGISVFEKPPSLDKITEALRGY